MTCWLSKLGFIGNIPAVSFMLAGSFCVFRFVVTGCSSLSKLSKLFFFPLKSWLSRVTTYQVLFVICRQTLSSGDARLVSIGLKKFGNSILTISYLNWKLRDTLVKNEHICLHMHFTFFCQSALDQQSVASV